MTTFGITRIRDEVDIAAYSVIRMLAQTDHVIVGEGSSTDGTREALEDLVADGYPVTIIDDHKLNWQQADVITGFAHLAGSMGATWVVPFDADETFLAVEGTIKARLKELPPEAYLVPAANLTHCVTDLDDPEEKNPMMRLRWRSVQRLPLPKVACRIAGDLVIEHGSHAARYTTVRYPLSALNVLQVRHYPYREADQFVKRVQIAWPQLRDSGLDRSHGQHMWEYGELLDREGPEGLRAWFRQAMTFADPANDPNIVEDPVPPVEDFLP